MPVPDCPGVPYEHPSPFRKFDRPGEAVRSPGEIKLEVSDDGKGLDHETQSKIASGETVGVGLRGMRERVRQLGGKVEIRSNGHGTIVTATVPVAESEDGQLQSYSGMPNQKATSPA